MDREAIRNFVVSRREFLERCGWIAAGSALAPRWVKGEGGSQSANASSAAYGSGHFGSWVTDEFGLPAFHYTCDQTSDPKAAIKSDEAFRSATDHTHQVGNDRLVAAVSNYGYVQVRQDEGSPKFLNDYSPERAQFGGGIGYLTDGRNVLSTFYSGHDESFDRVFGMGYLRKKVAGAGYAIDQVIFAPYGDDPALISQTTLTNHGAAEVDLRWVEYWGCQPYQFSFRSWMQADIQGVSGKSVELRRKFSDRFSHKFRRLTDGSGMVETKQFLGRSAEDRRLWQAVMDAAAANGANAGLVPAQSLAGSAGMEDLHPPPTFLVSLDGPAQGFATSGKEFFGAGGVQKPAGMSRALDGDLSAHGPDSALLLERKFTLKPGESRTLRFLYGYLPHGTELTALVQKYRAEGTGSLARSSERWNQSGLQFSTEAEPWVEREVLWSHYYVRSNLTYDDAFDEHIITQGSIYQYIMGLQGAARDPLQHVLPFLFSDPKIVKEILRYTFKEVREDGSIPYSIVGHGVPMPTAQDDDGDLPLWLIWVACEYILATRDFAFLDEQISAPLVQAFEDKATVGQILARCYRYMVEDVGTGPHGLMRMLMDDWLDALVFQAVPPKWREEYIREGESVLDSAMASYVFDRYASVLACVDAAPELVADAKEKAEQHRQAVRAQWTGQWFRRAWLGPHLGWVGDDSLWIEPQSWAIIGGAATAEQSRTLVAEMDERLRKPSPIGAMRWAPGPQSRDQSTDKKAPDGAKARVCASLNGTLIWALAQVDGKMAWDEWKKNSLAVHAEAYPDVWYGVWSGPDVYNGALRDLPGELDPSSAAMGTGKDDFSSLEYPVMNMHPHAWPVYNAARVLGLEFTPKGAVIKVALPLETYRFASPLFGFEKSERGYEGWYAPHGRAGAWSIVVQLPEGERRKFARKRVNGVETALVVAADGTVEIHGSSGLEKPLRWSIRA